MSTVPLDLFTPRKPANVSVRDTGKKSHRHRNSRISTDWRKNLAAYRSRSSWPQATWSREYSPARYLEAWKEKHEALLKYAGDDLETDRSLLATFQLSYDRLDAPEAALLRLFAWLAPEAFPRSLVEDSKRVKEILSANQKNSETYDVSDALSAVTKAIPDPSR